MKAQKGLETELKYHLDKVDYFRLLRACRRQRRKTVKQVNYYFDDAKLRLRKKRFGLRIRILDGNKAIVTLKHPAKRTEKSFMALKVRHEYEQRIAYKTALLIIQGKKRLCDLDIEPIRVLRKMFPESYLKKIVPLGCVRTVRTIVPIQGKVELELDRCRMFEERFYELEVETEKPKAADKTVRQLLKKYDIRYEPLSKSKLGRFLDLWKRAS